MKLLLGRDRRDGGFEPLGTAEDVDGAVRVQMVPGSDRTANDVYRLLDQWRYKALDYATNTPIERSPRELVEAMRDRMIGPYWRAQEVTDDESERRAK